MLSVTPALAAGPGFGCAKATRQIDKAICAWYTVGSLDGRMADTFKATLAAQKNDAAIASVRASQKAWLAERDRRCGLANVTPKAGSEEGLSPRQFGQLLCLQALYPSRIAQLMPSSGSELESFQLDPTGARLFYNGEDGLVVTDPDSRATRRLKDTHGTSSETRPINMSADGEILIYSASNSCTRDAAEAAAPDADDDNKRGCLAYLASAGSPPMQTAKMLPADAALVDPSSDLWVGTWNGDGGLSAAIRRGTAKPDYLVIDLYAGAKGCSGAVTLYGKPKGTTVLGESYDPKDPSAPVCRVELALDKGVLKTLVAGPCTSYHGASCGFDGTMMRDK